MPCVMIRILTIPRLTVSKQPTDAADFKAICAESGQTAQCCTVSVVSTTLSWQLGIDDWLTNLKDRSLPPLRHPGWSLRDPAETTATGNYGVGVPGLPYDLFWNRNNEKRRMA